MSPKARRVALVLSTVGHPFVLVPAATATVGLARSGWATAVYGAGLVATAAVLPLAIVIHRRVSANDWSDADVSDRIQRHGFYAVAIPAIGGASGLLWLAGAPGWLVSGTLAAAALLVAAAVLNRILKISLHMSFALFATVVVAAHNPAAGIVMGLLAAATAWSRVALGRHTRLEVVVGALLGVLSGWFSL